MVARTTTEQSTFLLERRVAEARRSGAMSPDAEAIALFESIALNLLLKPRAALLFALLARNGLRKAILDELESIDSIKNSIADLGNVVLDVTSTKQLESARLALLQLEQLDRISTSNNQFKKFDSAVSEFLNKTISKSVRKLGATSLTRPGSEASTDMLTEFTNLVDLHGDLIDRLYALVVGVDNFLNSPLSTVIGLTTASRARSDIEELIEDIEESGSLQASRDMAIRLITDRAAVRVIGEFPSIVDPVLDSVKELPTTFSVKGQSDPATASRVSSSGPFALPLLAQVSMTVNGVSVPLTNIPQTTFDLQNKAAVAGAAVAFPINIPANYYLFVAVNGTVFKLPVTAGAAITKAAFLADIAAAITASPLAGLLHVVEFIQVGTNRMLIYHDTASTIGIATVHTGLPTDLIGGSEATSTSSATYTNSIHAIIGFEGTETGVSGDTPSRFVSDALDLVFGSLVNVVAGNDQTFIITTLASSPGTTLVVSAPTVLGINGTFPATSDTFRLYGTVEGVATDPVNPVGLVDFGDTVLTTTGTSTISAITATRIRLVAALPTFDGNLTITSALTIAYNSLIALLNQFLAPWLTSPFGADLDKLNLAIATLGTGSPQSQRNVVLESVNDLEVRLTDLLAKIDDPSTTIPSTSASGERNIVDGITTSLAERKFDRALNLFLRCKIQEGLDSTVETASFGGNLLKAASDFARTDMVVPNRALDEEVEGVSSQEIKGL